MFAGDKPAKVMAVDARGFAMAFGYEEVTKPLPLATMFT